MSNKDIKGKFIYSSLVVGAGIGIVFGVINHNIVISLVIGAAFGLFYGVTLNLSYYKGSIFKK